MTVEEVVRKAHSYSREVESVLREQVTLSPDAVLVIVNEAYLGVAGHVIRGMLLSVRGRGLVLNMSPAEYLTYLAPYVAHEAVYMLASHDYIVPLADLSRLMRVRGAMITRRVPEPIKPRLRGFKALELDLDPAAMNIPLAVGFARRLSAQEAPSRRLEMILDSLEQLPREVSSLLDHYAEELSLVSSALRGPCLIASSDIMAPASRVFWYEALKVNPELPPPMSLVEACMVRAKHQVIAVATEFDEPLIKRLRLRCRSLVELTLRTDPVTAPLYAMILCEEAVNRARGR